MEPQPRPLLNKIIVRLDEPVLDELRNGLWMPQQSQRGVQTGTVLRVGAGRPSSETGEIIPLAVKPGDRVAFSYPVQQLVRSQFADPFEVGGSSCIFLPEEHVLAVLEP